MFPWLLAAVALVASGILAARYVRLHRRWTALQQSHAHTLKDLKNQLERVQELQDSLLRGVEDVLFVLTPDERILFANPAAKRQFGDSIEGKTLVEALRQPELTALFHDAQKIRGEVMERRVEFDRKVFHARAVASPSGQFEIVTLRDMTEVQRLERARREMVSNITHELSTPITSLGLLTETLLNVADHEKRKRVRKMAKDIRRETDTLMQLVQEIRDLSLIESGQMPIRLTPTPLRPIIEASLQQLESLVENKGQHIELNAPENITVLVDEHQIQRAIKNIIHNAIKFSPEGERITITVELNGAEAIIAVKDNGPGIPEEDLPRVFERFFQVDQVRRDGTGLGLAIVRHIVRAHGGRTWAESVEGEGATFYITLALADAIEPDTSHDG